MHEVIQISEKHVVILSGTRVANDGSSKCKIYDDHFIAVGRIDLLRPVLQIS